MRRILIALVLLLSACGSSFAQNVNLNCLTGTTSPNFWQPASSTNPCPVTLPAGTTVTATLSTAGYNDVLSVTPTIQAASYVSGNAVGALATVAVFRTVAQPSGILDVVGVSWLGTETAPLTFYIFNANPTGTTCADKAAFSLAAADIPKILSIGPFTLTAAAPTAGTTSTYAVSTFAPFSVKNKDGSPTVNLYVCAVASTTFTPAVGDLTYKLGIAQD